MTGWNWRFLEENMECWRKETSENLLFREHDIWHLNVSDWKYLKAWKLMERGLLDMTNQLFISEYNARQKRGDSVMERLSGIDFNAINGVDDIPTLAEKNCAKTE